MKSGCAQTMRELAERVKALEVLIQTQSASVAQTDQNVETVAAGVNKLTERVAAMEAKASEPAKHIGFGHVGADHEES